MISKVISEDKISAAKELIYEAQKIAIITHTSPDGDAMGSALGMFQFLKQLDKDATVVFPDDCPRGFEWMPGMDEVLIHRSQTEAAEAARAGADFVKLFPIGAFGPSYLKALCAPLSHIRFLAVGGVDEVNMRDYFEAGASGIGVGSGIVSHKLIQAGDFDAITALAEKYTSRI